MKKFIGITMILLGVVIISSLIFIEYKVTNNQEQMITDFQKTIEELDKEKTLGTKESESKIVKNTLGIITIPKIDLKVAIGDEIIINTTAGEFKYKVSEKK